MKKVVYIILTFMVAAALASSLAYVIGQKWLLFAGASAAKGKVTNNVPGTTQLLFSKEAKDGIYNWIDESNGASNPTLNIFVIPKNIIRIQNPY